STSLIEPKTQIRFGTDGWRAIIAREFTFANVERVSQAYADYLLRSSQMRNGLVVVGYDRRFMSEQFARRAAEVLAANGFRLALFSEAQPTPLISWCVKELSAAGGVMITASHNPAEFNGFKIKAPWGGSADPETTAAVERFLDVNPPRRVEFSDNGQHLLEPVTESYRAQVSSYIEIGRLLDVEARVIADPMHGSAGHWFQSFLQNGQIQVETIRAYRDPLFGGVHPEPIDSNLDLLKQRVVEAKALAGLATDGDADRVGAVNDRGETMTMHDVVPLLLLHLARERKMTGAVVRTFSQSVLLKRIAAACSLELYETPIGFKYIAELMLKKDILIGAEESGGIGVKGHIPERDGILNSLLFLEAIIAAGKSPSAMLAELHQEFGEFHFGRRDLHMDTIRGAEWVAALGEQPPEKVSGYLVTEVQTMDGTKLIFDDESWLLFRQSGTEPVLRIYAEGTSVQKKNALLDAGQQMAH
ncbi:MAG TPA: phosphoglucomutase/phosphomannomutase family protein, partial [Pyrinomonadaceae bacterium]|nr:phosphoglucomutase/phosphomannomutase family protein [Pyrinomonadaceae bacterium]